MSALFLIHLVAWKAYNEFSKKIRKTSKKIDFKRLNSSPDPTWKPLKKQNHPYDSSTYTTFDPSTMESCYSLLISTVAPRPIAFVSSIDKNGIGNLAPFSYFGIASHSPPTVVIGVCYNRDGTKKDTLRNIEETQEFVVNMIGDWMTESANYTSAAFPHGIDEMKQAGLTPLASETVKPPRVAESVVQMECKLSGIHTVTNADGAARSGVIFGTITRFHVLDTLVETSKTGPQVKLDDYRPMSRVGGDVWAAVGDNFDLRRPTL